MFRWALGHVVVPVFQLGVVGEIVLHCLPVHADEDLVVDPGAVVEEVDLRLVVRHQLVKLLHSVGAEAVLLMDLTAAEDHPVQLLPGKHRTHHPHLFLLHCSTIAGPSKASLEGEMVRLGRLRAFCLLSAQNPGIGG